MKLEQMREIAEKRTKGKWLSDKEATLFRQASIPFLDVETGVTHHRFIKPDDVADSEFICMSSNHFDALLRVVEAARELERASKIDLENPLTDDQYYELGVVLFQALDDLELDE